MGHKGYLISTDLTLDDEDVSPPTKKPRIESPEKTENSPIIQEVIAEPSEIHKESKEEDFIPLPQEEDELASSLNYIPFSPNDPDQTFEWTRGKFEEMEEIPLSQEGSENSQKIRFTCESLFLGVDDLGYWTLHSCPDEFSREILK